jgi:hypothetical protein
VVVIATFLQHSKERIDYGRVELRACSIEQHWIHFLPRYNKKIIPFLLESAELKKFNSAFQAPNPFLQMSMRYMPFSLLLLQENCREVEMIERRV